MIHGILKGFGVDHRLIRTNAYNSLSLTNLSLRDLNRTGPLFVLNATSLADVDRSLYYIHQTTLRQTLY